MVGLRPAAVIYDSQAPFWVQDGNQSYKKHRVLGNGGPICSVLVLLGQPKLAKQARRTCGSVAQVGNVRTLEAGHML